MIAAREGHEDVVSKNFEMKYQIWLGQNNNNNKP